MRRRLLVEKELNFKPIEESLAADICIVDNNTLEKYIVDGETYSTDLYPAEQYTPIGVVVVPASHTDDGTARIISLAGMSYYSPDNGNTNSHSYIYWGGGNYSNIENLNDKTATPYITNTGYSGLTDTQTLVEWAQYLFDSPTISSDYFNNSYPNPFDEGTCFGENKNKLSPSPYLTGGAKNPIYHSTENTGNILADMNGKNNTDIILDVDNSNSTDWQTASSIRQVGNNKFIHPAAQCCWRYHTTGTTQGDWYLPAAGELGYLAARWNAINASITKVNSNGFNALELEVYNSYYWSSSEYSDLYVTYLTLSNGSADLSHLLDGKIDEMYVRAFCAI